MPLHYLTVTASLDAIPITTIDGAPSSLGAFAGQVRLVVNVASQCGLTPQYTALEALYRRFRERGFTILAFPANEFDAQEPGTNAEIAAFCATRYDVTFPLFAKLVVVGPGQHPLYAALTSAQPDAIPQPGGTLRDELVGEGLAPPAPHDLLWNFEKFLVGRDGSAIARFAPDVPPDADVVIAAIERALAE